MATKKEKWTKYIQDKIDVLTEVKESVEEKCNEILSLASNTLHSTSVKREEQLSTCIQMEKFIFHLSDCQQQLTDDTETEGGEISRIRATDKITDVQFENLSEKIRNLEKQQSTYDEQQTTTQENLTRMTQKIKLLENRDNIRIGEIKNMKKKIEESLAIKQHVVTQTDQIKSCFFQIEQLDSQLRSRLDTQEQNFQEMNQHMRKFMKEIKLQEVETKKLSQEMSAMETKIKTENEKCQEKIITLEEEIKKINKETENLEKQQTLAKKERLELNENLINQTKQMEEDTRKTDEKCDGLLALMQDKIQPLEHLRQILNSSMSPSPPAPGSLAHKVEKLESDLSLLTKEEIFAFTVWTDWKTVKSDEVISRYNTILTNRGDQMDAKSGIFTAPVKGVYCFIVRVTQNLYEGQEGEACTSVWAETSQRGTVLVSQAVTDESKHLTDTDLGCIELNQGDQVFVKVDDCPKDVQILVTFSGWLIK